MSLQTQTWPEDADGDVFRRLSARGFNFSEAHIIDYNVDFTQWPPSDHAVEVLKSMYGEVTVFEPSDEGEGYIQLQVRGPVTYEGVTSIQRTVCAAMESHGGWCESWGVLQDAP